LVERPEALFVRLADARAGEVRVAITFRLSPKHRKSGDYGTGGNV
jgi:hypothetical protein